MLLGILSPTNLYSRVRASLRYFPIGKESGGERWRWLNRVNGVILRKSSGKKSNLCGEKGNKWNAWSGEKAHRNSEEYKNREKSHGPTKKLRLNCSLKFSGKKVGGGKYVRKELI